MSHCTPSGGSVYHLVWCEIHQGVQSVMCSERSAVAAQTGDFRAAEF